MRPQPSLRVFFASVGLASSGLVGGGLLLARTLNLAACPLCILQRMLYLLIAAISLLGWLLARQPGTARLLSLLAGLAALLGAGIAAYQTWLQRFAKGVSCTADQPWWERFVDWAGQQIPLLFEATGLCSEAGWKFIGLSIAEWSLAIFSILAFAAFRQTLQRAP